MMEQRTAYRSSTRNFRAPAKRVRSLEVGGPTGARSSTTAQDQAQAIRKTLPGAGLTPTLGGAPAPPQPSLLSFLPKEVQGQIVGGYQTGGFEGITNAIGPDWYDIPDYMRTDILKQVSGR